MNPAGNIPGGGEEKKEEKPEEPGVKRTQFQNIYRKRIHEIRQFSKEEYGKTITKI